MHVNNANVKRRRYSLSGALLTIARVMKEVLMLIIASDFLARGFGSSSPIGQRYLHIVETWHIWVAIAAYLTIAICYSQSAAKNLKYIRAVLRRIIRTYRTSTR